MRGLIVDRVREVRRLAGLSQHKVANRLNMSFKSYRRRETGEISFRIDELIAFNEIVGPYDLRYFFDEAIPRQIAAGEDWPDPEVVRIGELVVADHDISSIVSMLEKAPPSVRNNVEAFTRFSIDRRHEQKGKRLLQSLK